MKKIIVLILIILLTSFSFGHKIKIGTYRSVKISRIEQLSNYIFKGINYVALGSEIMINSDFTFRYVTCGTIIEGFWTEKNDYIESIDTLSNGEWILERLKIVNL